MTKILTTAVILLAAGATLTASGLAQQTDVAKPATASSSTSTTHKTATTSKAATAKSPSGELKTQKEKASYAIGMNIANGLKRDSVEVDPAALSRGLKDALAGDKLLMTEDEAKAAIMELEKEVKATREAKMKIEGEENKKKGEAFLAANRSKEGIVTLPDGLQYKVEKQGDGPKPTASDTVQCHYRGTLINGKEFDSSYKRGMPASFAVSGVIPGWTEVLQLMPVGSKYQVFIPSSLAYKERSAGADIGPNSTLIFDIELLAVNPAKAAKSTEPAK